ncbi:MAG: 5-methyltetrahydrofolate--homocysteine methyltransferase [Fimbriimonadales bacterium]|nr:MAG: 5-methyltetrahydrofolate--homocysteine methyltransferase [Fimbriimonadales bacterium]
MERSPLVRALRERVLVCDGALGTEYQARNLTTDDFGGHDGCNEFLCLSRPDVVRELHRAYFEAGSDVVETNTFGAIRYVLDEYGIGDRMEEICAAAARLAREAADATSTPDKPRFVLGALGPGTKLVTLGQVAFDEIVESYATAFATLIQNGVDALLLETLQDLLHLKAALVAAGDAMERTGVELPVLVQVTIEQTGTMLLGTEIEAAILTASLFPYVVGFGMNCATGPEEMAPYVRAISKHWDGFVSVQPNAGLPEVVDGRTVYRLTPTALAEHQVRFVQEFGTNLVGGCCGTTPAHIRALAEAVQAQQATRTEEFSPLTGLASLYQYQPYDQSPSFLIVGERTNANGSKRFRELLAEEDWQGLTEMAREQEAEGAHVLDVCTAYVGRDEVRDMDRLLFEVARQVTIPIMVDSTDERVIERSLKRLPGKPIVNSINFEDGDARTERVLGFCKRYGAAVVGLTIDEDGMAKDRERKVAIADRILEATRRYGIPDEDVFLDTLTFTLGSGDPEFRTAAVETIEAIREIMRRHPRVNTLLGVSNISFGLKPQARHILNSVFLHYALEAGLTSAIVHAGKILPRNQVPDALWEAARRLVFNEWVDDKDPLVEFMARFEEEGATIQESANLEDLPIEERLKRHIIQGIRKDLEQNLDEALTRYEPLQIINEILLDGMKTVGDLFGEGKMQLPFVLQSAEVMKAAVRYLEPKMDRVEGQDRGSIVLATVSGDVHDIGKNLVDIILSNNGYRVVNIGIKQPLSAILSAAEEHNVDAIGMSGLLVKSTIVMRDNLLEMNELGKHHYPVLLGGAALTRSYVEEDLRKLYKGKVWYAQDAFEGLRIMQEISAGAEAEEPEKASGAPATPRPRSHRVPADIEALLEFDGTKSDVQPAKEIPTPPFWGRRVVRDISIEDVYPFINEVALFRGQWGYRRPKEMSNLEFNEYLAGVAAPEFEELKQELKEVFDPVVAYGYFPAQSEGNDLILYDPETHCEVERIRFPRQSDGRRLCIADFFASKESGRMDVAAFHIVTVGPRVTELERRLFDEGEYRKYLLVHGMGVETAEALAEYWHKRIREELGIAHEDASEIRLLFSTKYRGCRYSFGYPACPRLEDQAVVMRLLRPEEIGITLTEEYMLVPEQSTSAIICHHPEAKYFNIR